MTMIKPDGVLIGTQGNLNAISDNNGHIKSLQEWINILSDFVCWPQQSNDEIWYTSEDGNIVAPHDGSAFGVNILSNTYTDGKGIIKFDGDVTSIGKNAFMGCSSLTSITIPESVTSIGGEAFYGCKKLNAITINKDVAPTTEADVFGTILENYTGVESDTTNKLYIPSGATGYSGGVWDVLLDSSKCNFTIEYI